MKPHRLSFDQLQIDGFGHFHELKLELGPGLNVLYGDNGVGKSTLMAFVRSVLFGFARRNTPERYQTQGGRAFGGRVLLSTPHGELWVQRLDGKRAEGELTVKNGVMAAVPESRLREALASVDRELFEQVFAFGLDELRSWGQLMEAGKVKDALAAASMQGALRLPSALDRFDAEARLLWGKQATTRQLNVVLQQLVAVRGRRALLGDRPKDYFATRARLDATAVKTAQLHQALALAAREEFQLDRLSEATPHVHRAVEAAGQLAALGAVDGFPQEGLVRLEEALLALEAARGAQARAAAGAQGLQRRLAEVSGEVEARPANAAIAAAVDGWRQLAQLDAGLDERRADATLRERRLAEQVASLGLPTPIAAIDASAAARAGLGAARSRSGEAASRLEHAGQSARQATARKDEADRALALVAAEPALAATEGAPASLEQALEAARSVPNLEHQARIIQAQLEDRQTALAAAAVPDEPPPLARWPLWLVAASCGALLALAGAAFVAAGAGAGVGALGLALSICAVLLTVHRQDHTHWLSSQTAHVAVLRHRKEHRDRLTAELQSSRARLATLHERLAALRLLAGVADEAIEPRLAELERLAGAASRRAELVRDAALGRARQAAARDEEQQALAALTVAQALAATARAALDAQLQTLGLPLTLEAPAALELLAEVAVAQGAARTLADHSAALERDSERVALASLALEQAAQQAGITGGMAAQLVAGLAGWLETTAGLRAEAAALRSRSADAQGALAAAQADQAQAQRRVDGLIAAAQVADVEQFRAAGALFETRAQLSAMERLAAARVHAVCGVAVEVAHAQLLEAPGVETRLAQAREGRLALETQRRVAHEQHGALTQQLLGWESDDQLAQLLAHEQRLAARAEELARRFAVARLGEAVLAQAREKFEAEHQPQVVQRAGQLFTLLTDGRYPRLALEAGAGALQAVDSQGRLFSVEQLSRGTREQLLTALRLAMIEDFGRERLALPVMVDDVLVNFDPHRAQRMVEALAELARRHQVIAFTCHPQTRELFKDYGAKALEVSTRAQLALLPT